MTMLMNTTAGPTAMKTLPNSLISGLSLTQLCRRNTKIIGTKTTSKLVTMKLTKVFFEANLKFNLKIRYEFTL